MTDSPVVHVPIEPKEEPILLRLQEIRDELSLLKQDRTSYVKSQDVLSLYDRVVAQVRDLDSVRAVEHKTLEQNKVDTVLEDCFQLISLFFMTIGRIDEAPAHYAETSTLKRLLDHLKEAGFYSHKDVQGLHRRIDTIRSNTERGKSVYSPNLIQLLEKRLDVCSEKLAELDAFLDTLTPSLYATWEKLVSILRSLSAANTRSKFPENDVKNLEKEVRQIEAQMVDGRFVADDGAIPKCQDILLGLIDRCKIWVPLVMEKRGTIDPRFKGTYEKLLDIRNQLEKLTLTQAWSLRETDLYQFQRQLDRVDESRVDGNFLDEAGQPAELHAQRTLLYLLRRSYAYIYSLILSSEPVSEALLPIYNQLQTLRRCLIEVQGAGGVSSPRELYPYSMKLNSIDSMRVDGNFVIGQDIPEGQASVKTLLAECYDITYQLKVEAEEADADDGADAGANGVEAAEPVTMRA